MWPLFWAYYLATAVLVSWLAWSGFGWYRKTWFGVSQNAWYNQKLDWQDVERLMTADPLEHNQGSLRPYVPLGMLRLVPILLLAVAAWLCGLIAIHWLDLDPFNKDNIEVMIHLVGLLGFAGAAVKVIYEWRLKARSENRQKWIDELRGSLTLLIGSMPLPNDGAEDGTEKKKAYFAEHGKLELLLNPSERDHRALMALIRHIYGYGDSPIDRIPRQKLHIGFSRAHPGDDFRELDFDELKSQAIRLANAVLKREWERVRHIR
jgi:hypothetical protein